MIQIFQFPHLGVERIFEIFHGEWNVTQHTDKVRKRYQKLLSEKF
jgi:hypothetical protein